MNSQIRRLLLGALLTTSTTATVLGIGVEAASAAGVSATVRTKSGDPLNVRVGPSTQTATASQVRNGTVVSLACQGPGEYVNGAVRATAQWDRLTSGRWISHAYVQTNASLPSCAALDAPASTPANPSGTTVHTDGGVLNVRMQPTTQSDRTVTLANGAAVTITCQVNGETVRGTVRSTAQWDQLASGGYISHAYVETGMSIPSCAPDPAPAPVTDPTPAPAPSETPDPAPSPAPTPTQPATYDATARTEGGPLNIRSGPSTSTGVAGMVANGGALTLTCAVGGDYVSGAVRATSQWDKLVSGNYVAHAYVDTSASLPTCAGGAPVTGGSGPIGSMTNAQFIAAAVAPAQQGYREFGVPASVTIAQAILESGWGRSGLTANDRNYFGIKCFGGSPGPIASGCHTYATYECTPNCSPTYASFRTYATITDSFRDHGYFLTTNSRYKPAFSYTHDADQFLYQIWKAGYATSPTYVSNVQALMRQYNLYQYDNI